MLTTILIKISLLAGDTRGVTGIETGLLVAGISTAIVGAGFFFGDELRELYGTLSTALEPGSTYTE